MYTFIIYIYKYLHSHGYEVATLRTTIYVHKHSTAKNSTRPLYSYLLVQSYSIRAPPWPFPPAYCGLVYRCVICQSLSGEVVIITHSHGSARVL